MVKSEAAVGASETASLAGETVYVVDANSLIFQVFHALPEMTSPLGEPVNAVFGFTRDLLYLIEEKRPNYLFCAFDLPGPTFRHALYGEYKAERGEMPPELGAQYPKIHAVVERLGVPGLSEEGFEADDLLATIARVVDEAGGECVLVTGDKDCRQLITDRVAVYNVRKDLMYDATALLEDWGIAPEQVVDFQSLVGDKVDNVPGVPLIGPKIARELLGKYETLEGVLDHAEEVSGKKRKENLIKYRDQALLSRKLVRLDAAVPMEIPFEAGRVGGLDHAGLAELFSELGFRTLTERMRSLDAGHAPAEWKQDYRAVTTRGELETLVARMSEQSLVAFDTETTSVDPNRAEIVGYSFAWEEGEAYYVPVRSPEPESHLGSEEALEILRPVLESPSVGKAGQNLKYDMLVLRRAGAELGGVAFDTMVASYLLEPGSRSHNLDELATRYLNHKNIKISSLIGSGKDQRCISEAPLAAVTDYACEDADVALRLVGILEEKLEAAELAELFREVEVPLIEVLVELEFNGIRVDRARLETLSATYGERIATLEKEVYELAGREFNIASPKQLQEILFTEQGLPVLKRTKTGPSTDASVLEELAAQHPLPAKIIEYRQYAKLKSTYVDALPQLAHEDTGRIHASFNQVVAATGRLSSSDPNLQNIPIRTEAGREIRSAFLPGEAGWQLMGADYSQIELRVLAHFSKDAALCEAFARDEDIHTLVAAEVHGVGPDEVTKEMRRSAKAVNFGVVYGQSPFGLAKQLGISQDEAARFIDAYFERYAGVEALLSRILEDCKRDGYVKTILGRKRFIQGIRSTTGRQRNLPERTAINTVIQGSAADLIKQAMTAVYRRLRKEELRTRLLLQIHDELVLEVPEEELSQTEAAVREEMTGIWELQVPLKVEVATGATWAEI